MENKEDLLRKINSREPELLAEAIAEIKGTGEISIVPSLLDILAEQPGNHTTTALVNLLADIRENSVKEIIVNRIKETGNIDVKSVFIRICWESSLDYSEHLDVFVHIMLHDNFSAAFEASTAIENMLHNISREKRCELIKTLSTFRNPDEQRKFLIDDLLNNISSIEDETEEIGETEG